ncbi:uncharacterized protein HaLaN_13382 [Haematococcus lacustris]|uniref:Uncharacterized protein n=1 Tax=Haematococcus lacustris TaxID=44745 RepID=A0A699Z5P7_HAELA|nr:uncharacterized protein HaLaN_13382 [Haematococcus lacustris]
MEHSTDKESQSIASISQVEANDLLNPWNGRVAPDPASVGQANFLAERPAKGLVKKEKEGKNAHPNIHSIHGEQAARRRAIAELIFFAGVNDLRRCKQIVSVWNIKEAARNDHYEVVKLLTEKHGCVWEDDKLVTLEQSKIKGIVNTRRMAMDVRGAARCLDSYTAHDGLNQSHYWAARPWLSGCCKTTTPRLLPTTIGAVPVVSNLAAVHDLAAALKKGSFTE